MSGASYAYVTIYIRIRCNYLSSKFMLGNRNATFGALERTECPIFLTLRYPEVEIL